MQSRTTAITLTILSLVLIAGGYFAYTKLRGPVIPDRTTEVVERTDLNLTFTYTGGKDGYAFVEPPLSDEMNVKGIDGVFIMMDADEYASYRELPPGGESPKSMTVFVVKEGAEATSTTVGTTTERIDRKTKLRAWAEENALLTSYNLAQGTIEDVEIDGASAIRYAADGLYPQVVYIVYFSDRYYLFVGQYDGEGDSMKGDFDALVQSVLLG
jgi:hypothetical protein